LAKLLVRFVIWLLFRPDVQGLEHCKSTEGGLLVVSNRTSRLDAVILGSMIDAPLTLVLDKAWPRGCLINLLSLFCKIIYIDYDKPLDDVGIKEELAENRVVVVFPEAVTAISSTIMKITQEASVFAYETKAAVQFACIDGPQYTCFGQVETLHHKPRQVKTNVFFHPPALLEPPQTEGLGRMERKRKLAKTLHRKMLEARFFARKDEYTRNIWVSLLKCARTWGKDKVMLEDASRKTFSYGEFIDEARLYASKFKDFTAPGEHVGLVLPNSSLNALAMFALWSIGRVPVLLNYTQGPSLLSAALKTAQIKTILTSKSFLTDSGLGKMFASVRASIVHIDGYNFSRLDRLKVKFGGDSHLSKPADVAVIVFTSGSEGLPKGVAHSHISLLSNNYQTITCFGFTGDDIIFDAMPLFHTMGLNLLFLMPVLTGSKCFLYLSPLHAHTIPSLVYETKSTLLVASDTFANAWAREANQLDFQHLRYLLAGSERIKTRTHDLYSREFGVRILEGYGVTETSPAISINTPSNFKLGSCGQVWPGLQTKVEPVEGVASGGIIHVKGPNVMMGYIYPENPGVIVPPPDGWHNTGDIVTLDDDGFVFIQGRHKRFAKIAGEMISLVAVEEVVNQLWPGRQQAVLALDDQRRGEKLVLVTEEQTIDLAPLREAIRAAGLPDFYCPRQYIHLDKIPLYPVGKINMPQLIQEVKNAVQEGKL
jgi:acyl-[acyl-carrier-protein]-phospholipid O-acyltransferase/long-chain-fatty-acid--[acyl-carrier-protein] ligase